MCSGFAPASASTATTFCERLARLAGEVVGLEAALPSQPTWPATNTCRAARGDAVRIAARLQPAGRLQDLHRERLLFSLRGGAKLCASAPPRAEAGRDRDNRARGGRRMNAPDTAARPLEWPEIGPSRVPYPVYTDPARYREELERFFYRGHWCYVGLEAEIPNPGDFKRTRVGERSVILVRDAGRRDQRRRERLRPPRHAVLPRAPRQPARTSSARTTSGTTTLKGDLQGVPFRRGVQAGRQGRRRHAGRLQARGARPDKLKVAARGGVVFASFDPDVEPLEDFLGPDVLPLASTACSTAGSCTILGYNRQRIPGNWKLMQENIKDPYHPGLLHTWFVTFGLWRADNKSQLVMDAQHRHAAMISTRGRGRQGRAGHAGRLELQGEHEAQRPALPRHRARALVGRPDRGDD